MGVIIKGCLISNCGKGIVASSDIKLRISETVIEKVGVAIEISPPPPKKLRQVGLPDNTPIALLAEAVEILKQVQSNIVEVKQAAIAKSKLYSWLGNSASLATVTTAVMDLAKFFR